MGMYQSPTVLQQQVSIPSLVTRIDIHSELERALCSLGYVDILKIRITLRHAQHSIVQPKLFPSPLRHGTERGATTRVGCRIPHWQVEKLDEAVPSQAESGHFTLRIVELGPRSQECVMVVDPHVPR